MIIITEKPERTIDVIGYGIDSYMDKSGQKIWKVYGIVTPMKRGRIVTRDSSVIKDLYMDEETICIFRSANRWDVEQCKRVIDVNIAHGVDFFSVEAFKELLNREKELREMKQEEKVGTEIEDGVIVNED